MIYEKLIPKKRNIESLLTEMIHTLIPASLIDSIVSLTPSCNLKLETHSSFLTHLKNRGYDQVNFEKSK